MPDLHWTVPVAHWSSWSLAAIPEVGFIEPMVRRRLSRLSKVALKVAHDCTEERPDVRMVFASRHGELRRTTEILDAIAAVESVSPTAFSLSVLNAMSGIFGIARKDRAPANAISAGAETLGYALVEAYAQYASDASVPVLLVYADEPADSVYGRVEDEVSVCAIAILLDAATARGRLGCRVEDSIEATMGQASDTSVFANQGDALLHCLEHRTGTAWRRNATLWQWSWHDDVA